MTASTDLFMFAIIFVMGFVFSLMGATELTILLEKKKSGFLAIICNMIATVVWFPFTLVWFTTADLTMYFAFGYLWLALGFVFLSLTLLSVGLYFRYSVQPEEKQALEIKERSM